MKKYKIGDSVKIRSDLVPGNRYGEEMFMEEMVDNLGKEAKIVALLTEDEYFLDVDQDNPWGWTAEMFE